MIITVAGRNISWRDAHDFLVDDYNSETVLYYDYAGDENASSPDPSPPGISLEDIGRVVCIAGSLTYRRGHELLRVAGELEFPELETECLEEIEGSGQSFLTHPDVERLAQLSGALLKSDGLGWGTVGKVLHLKYPSHLPVPDRRFRAAYESSAVRFHNDLLRDVATRKRRSRADLRAYWAVFHQDLIMSLPAIKKIRAACLGASSSGGPATARARRVAGLSPVRILDALAWGVGSRRIGA